MRVYSKYLMEIFNDRENGMKYLEKARKLENNNLSKKAIKLGPSNNIDIEG